MRTASGRRPLPLWRFAKFEKELAIALNRSGPNLLDGVRSFRMNQMPIIDRSDRIEIGQPAGQAN